jgi:hypothetical protein
MRLTNTAARFADLAVVNSFSSSPESHTFLNILPARSISSRIFAVPSSCFVFIARNKERPLP